MRAFENEIVKSLIKTEGVKHVLRDGFGYELDKKVIEAHDELRQYSKFGLLIEVSTEVSNGNIFDFIIYANDSEEETNLESSVFSFKVSREDILEAA